MKFTDVTIFTVNLKLKINFLLFIKPKLIENCKYIFKPPIILKM